MAATAFVIAVQAHLLGVDVVLEREMALWVANPDGAGLGFQGG